MEISTNNKLFYYRHRFQFCCFIHVCYIDELVDNRLGCMIYSVCQNICGHERLELTMHVLITEVTMMTAMQCIPFKTTAVAAILRIRLCKYMFVSVHTFLFAYSLFMM